MASVANISLYLPIMAQKMPNRMAITAPPYRGGDSITFGELERESSVIAMGLEEIGIKRKTRTLLMAQPSLDFYLITFALMKIGAILIMIDPGIGLKNLGTCLAETEPEAFIGIPKAHIARLLFGWGKGTLKIIVNSGSMFFPIGLPISKVKQIGRERDISSFRPADSKPEDEAAILFTSGSTGVPKGVVYTHDIFANQVEMLREMYGIEEGDIDLPTFPLFGLFAPPLGMSVVIPDMDATRPASVNPAKIVGAIKKFKITNMFGSPALLNRVGRYTHKNNIKLPTLKRVISAGAPASPQILERFSAALNPNTEIYTPYGATESLPVSSIGSREILEETKYKTEQGWGVCVGKPVDGVEVSIIAIGNTPIERWSDKLLLKNGEVGEIVVKSPVVTKSYYNRPKSTRLAKIYSEDGKDVYHRMGDLGYLDSRGRLWFCGRKAHRVITDTDVLFSVPCEGVFNAHPDVYRSALVGVKMGGKNRPVICIELEENALSRDRGEIRSELIRLGQKFPHTKDIEHFLFKNKFPVDIRHNAKIFRERLAEWAAEEFER
ncbi:MAG: AMP-binding protein [Nitrospinae bacterium]|nr:AMP-binding protein [Nitrospinota bacterium]